MSISREWLDRWFSPKSKSQPDRSGGGEANRPEPLAIAGPLLANLSPAGQRRLTAILQQNPVAPTIRFVAFRAETFREKDLLDSFEAMIKQPNSRTEARYVPHQRAAEPAE